MCKAMLQNTSTLVKVIKKNIMVKRETSTFFRRKKRYKYKETLGAEIMPLDTLLKFKKPVIVLNKNIKFLNGMEEADKQTSFLSEYNKAQVEFNLLKK